MSPDLTATLREALQYAAADMERHAETADKFFGTSDHDSEVAAAFRQRAATFRQALEELAPGEESDEDLDLELPPLPRQQLPELRKLARLAIARTSTQPSFRASVLSGPELDPRMSFNGGTVMEAMLNYAALLREHPDAPSDCGNLGYCGSPGRCTRHDS